MSRPSSVSFVYADGTTQVSFAAAQLKMRASPCRSQISGVASGTKKRSLVVSLMLGSVAGGRPWTMKPTALRVVGECDPVQRTVGIAAFERRRARPLCRRLARREPVAAQVQAPSRVVAVGPVVVDHRRRHLRLHDRHGSRVARDRLAGRVGQHGAVGHAGRRRRGSTCRRRPCRRARSRRCRSVVNGAAVHRALERDDVVRVLRRRASRAPRRCRVRAGPRSAPRA